MLLFLHVWPQSIQLIAKPMQCCFVAQARFPENTYLRVCYMDFLATSSVKSARKVCKAMLKQPTNRNNLMLLDRYAQLEISYKKFADAVKVSYRVVCSFRML